MPVGHHGYLALPQPRPRDSDACLAMAVDQVYGAKLWGFDASDQAARRELAAAVEAWREEKLERDWLAGRASWELMQEQGGVA